MSDELKQHEEAFSRLMREILVDVVRRKLGPLTTRANDALHKLDHLERLRETDPAPYDPSKYCALSDCKNEGCTRLAHMCLSKYPTAPKLC